MNFFASPLVRRMALVLALTVALGAGFVLPAIAFTTRHQPRSKPAPQRHSDAASCHRDKRHHRMHPRRRGHRAAAAHTVALCRRSYRRREYNAQASTSKKHRPPQTTTTTTVQTPSTSTTTTTATTTTPVTTTTPTTTTTATVATDPTTTTAPTTTTTATTPTTTTTTTTTTTPTTTTTSTPPPNGPPSIYWGATIGSQFTGSEPPWDFNAQTDFQNTDAGGKAASIMSWGSQFYSSPYCAGYCGFTTSLYQSVRNQGMIPWISWSTISSSGQSGYSDAQIAGGSQDSYIRQWAQSAKAWGHPFFLRFDWEMNGNWFPWGVGTNGNTAASYVAMWRHVHDIFSQVGATNATWVWCPNIDPSNTWASMSSLYPGDSYVDWTCLDGYNGNAPWTSFHNLFSSSYKQIVGSIAPSKPMIIGETGSTEAGGSKANWITNMFNDLPSSFPDVHGLLWYDVTSAGPGGRTDWPIETSSSSESAFAAGIGNTSYIGSSQANLSATPVPPPS